MDKIKNFDDFLQSDIADEFYDYCYKIIKKAYLEGYNYGKSEIKSKEKDNVINLPRN